MYWHDATVMPDGQAFWSRLDYQSIAPIDVYVALDGLSDESGAVNPEMPRARWGVAFAGRQDGTTVPAKCATLMKPSGRLRHGFGLR